MVKSQEQLAIEIAEQTVRLQKIQTETQSLIDRVNELLAIIAGGGEVTPELQAAFDALTAQVTVVDELVPDQPK